MFLCLNKIKVLCEIGRILFGFAQDFLNPTKLFAVSFPISTVLLSIILTRISIAFPLSNSNYSLDGIVEISFLLIIKLFGQSYEKSFRSADIAQSIAVFILDYFADKLSAVPS